MSRFRVRRAASAPQQSFAGSESTAAKAALSGFLRTGTRDPHTLLAALHLRFTVAIDHPGCHEQERSPQSFLKWTFFGGEGIIAENSRDEQRQAISPNLTENINRFGDFTLNLGRKPPQPDFGYTLKQTAFA